MGLRGDFGQAGAMGKTFSRMSTLNGSRSMLSRGGSGTSAVLGLEMAWKRALLMHFGGDGVVFEWLLGCSKPCRVGFRHATQDLTSYTSSPIRI